MAVRVRGAKKADRNRMRHLPAEEIDSAGGADGIVQNGLAKSIGSLRDALQWPSTLDWVQPNVFIIASNIGVSVLAKSNASRLTKKLIDSFV